jgi:hypothetical protein
VRNGRPEQRHESIAQKLIDGAFVAMNFRERQLEEAVEQHVHCIGAYPSGELGGVGDVAKQHRDQLAFALERGARGQDPVGQVRRRIGCRGKRMRFRAGRGQSCAAFPAEVLRLKVVPEAGGAFHLPRPYDG